jgi:hypothetical protein
MDFGQYASRIETFCIELEEFLTPEDKDAALAAVSAFSFDEWQHWRYQHSEKIERVAVATPAAKQRALSRVHGTEKLLLIFAAWQYILEAKEMLDALDRHCTSGISYRGMAKAIHKVKTSQVEAVESFWFWSPWPQYKGYPPQPDDDDDREC